LAQLSRIVPLADDAALIAGFRQAQRTATVRWADWLRTSTGQEIDPDSIFDGI
jgi:glycogen phosphorylase